jgi:hypothetical protein
MNSIRQFNRFSYCALKRTVVTPFSRSRVRLNVATKEHKRKVRGLIEGLEYRIHVGPPVRDTEIHSAKQFLLENNFSPSSDYFNRLCQIQNRLCSRVKEPPLPQVKRNYGGEAGGHFMQVQSAYDHVILSTCYDGELNCKRGRIKISHRFNEQGRIDFVELKFLQSLEPCLNGELRKLLMVSASQTTRKDWQTAEAFVLPVLPRELIFLYPDIFRCPRTEILAWLVNIGHGIVDDLRQDLTTCGPSESKPRLNGERDQLCLAAVKSDSVAWPIIEKTSGMEASIDCIDEKNVVVKYFRTVDSRIKDTGRSE